MSARSSSTTLVLLGALLCAAPACGERAGKRADPSPQDAGLATDVLASDLDTIWELAFAPDGMLWITERPGRISRVDPETGSVTQVGEIAVAEVGEGGLMGLCFHPDFAAEPWVYAAHTYDTPSGPRNRIVRMRYDGSRLGAPETLLTDIPGSSIHNGCRLAVGPDRLLYVTTGDAAAGARAQDPRSLAGKVLRLTLDGAPAPGNPFGDSVYSLGHRNAQGLVFAPDGSLYVTEHGPSDNDEVNRIEAGGNYGWPEVRGFCDGEEGADEVRFCRENRVVEPLAVWTPTIAPAGLDYYDATGIPGWRGSLLFTTLGGHSLIRLELSDDGKSVAHSEILFGDRFGRLRDVAVGSDGTVYLATSNRDGRGAPSWGDDRIIRIRPR